MTPPSSRSRASFVPVFRPQRSVSSSHDYPEHLDYDDDDEDMLNDNDSLAGSNADSVITDPASDPSMFKLEISILEDDVESANKPKSSSSSHPSESGKSNTHNDAEMSDKDQKASADEDHNAASTSSSNTTKHLTKDSLTLSNETLWDIFDLVFECENYKNSLASGSSSSGSASAALIKKPKLVYSPEFRKDMKHRYNLLRNAVYDKCNTKFDSIFESGAYDNNSFLVATLLPCLTEGKINTIDKKDTNALVNWLQNELTPQLAQFWDSMDPEKTEKESVSQRPPIVPGKSYFTTLNREIEFINSINRDLDQRRKLMDGIVVDLASIVSIGGGKSQTGPESPMATMGPILAAKMVADTLPIARISKFIPHLARFSYAKNVVQLNEIITNEIKDVVIDTMSLNSDEEKALYVANDFEGIVNVFSPKNTGVLRKFATPTSSFSLATSSSTSSSVSSTTSSSSTGSTETSTATSHSDKDIDLVDIKMEQEDTFAHPGLSSSPPTSGSSTTSRHPVSFFPHNNRRTASISSMSSILSGSSSGAVHSGVPSGQYPLGSLSRSSSTRVSSTPLSISLFPAAGISSSFASPPSTSSALSSVSGASLATTPGTPGSPPTETEVDEKRLVGPLLSPLLTLNVISPNLETVYPDYLSFLHTVFTTWTNANTSAAPGLGMAFGAGVPTGAASVGGSMSPPPARPSFIIPENVKMQTALGGIYLTLINHSTTRKVPAIAKCFVIMQQQLQTNSRIQIRDLDALKAKLVEVYNEWVQSQPPSQPLARRSPNITSTDAELSISSLNIKGPNSKRASPSLKSANGVAKKLSAVNGSRIAKSGAVQKNGQRVASSSAATMGAAGDLPLPASSNTNSNSDDVEDPEVIKSNHKRTQSTSSNASEAYKSNAPALPAPCQKCYHNHKGNNCARKCYVCRMAKLAAQHGHIVELKTPAPGVGSPTTAVAPALATDAPGSASSNSTIASPNAASHNTNFNNGNFNNSNHTRNYSTNNAQFSNAGGIDRSNSMKSRNGGFARPNYNNNNQNNNYSHNNGIVNGNGNGGGAHRGHNRTQSYSTNSFNNGGHRRTQSYSFNNGGHNNNNYNNNYNNNNNHMNGNNYNNNNNPNNNNGNGNRPRNGNGNANGHRRQPSAAANTFAMRLGQQYQGNEQE